MCFHGTLKEIEISSGKKVKVDACIADEIEYMNKQGAVTVGCCCGHGGAGTVVEYENGFGTWREFQQPPVALITEESREAALKLRYRPYPYYYADGTRSDLLQIMLKTGCLTEDDCEASSYPVSCER